MDQGSGQGGEIGGGHTGWQRAVCKKGSLKNLTIGLIWLGDGGGTREQCGSNKGCTDWSDIVVTRAGRGRRGGGWAREAGKGGRGGGGTREQCGSNRGALVPPFRLP